MSIIRKIKLIFKEPTIISDKIASRLHQSVVSDERYLKMKFKNRMGKELDLESPQTFNEKLQYLKLYDRNPLYTKLVDKYKVREYVAKTIGEEYLVPLYGVWDNFDDIDFSKLPNSFVLKTNHDSSGAIICEDKEKFDVESARKRINYSLNRNYFYSGREWAYKNVEPRIICEKYLEDKTSIGLKDYKYLCFDGMPELLYVVTGPERDQKIDFYDLDFMPIPVKQVYEKSSFKIEKPKNFEKMLELSKKLSEKIPHVRVDFYELDGKIYFGELTFYNYSGMAKFNPESFDYELGKLIDISQAFIYH